MDSINNDNLVGQMSTRHKKKQYSRLSLKILINKRGKCHSQNFKISFFSHEIGSGPIQAIFFNSTVLLSHDYTFTHTYTFQFFVLNPAHMDRHEDQADNRFDMHTDSQSIHGFQFKTHTQRFYVVLMLFQKSIKIHENYTSVSHTKKSFTIQTNTHNNPK